jgi:hypothetical protein
MIRFLVRTLGLLVIAAGFAALVVDGTRSIAASDLRVIAFGDIAGALFPVRFPQLQPLVERQIHPLLWDPVLATLFSLPAWLVLALAGLLLMWLTARRRPQVGYSARE